MSDLVISSDRLTQIALLIKARFKRQGEDVLMIGQLAKEARSLLHHGEFTAWVLDSLELSPRLIRGYIAVYERFGKSEIFAVLPPSALLILASPSVPDVAVAEVERRLQAGERFGVRHIEGVIDKYRLAESLHVGATLLLNTYGTKPDGTPSRTISRSAVTSATQVTADVLARGAIDIEGVDHPVPEVLPRDYQRAITSETQRRRDEHISANAYQLIVDRETVTVVLTSEGGLVLALEKAIELLRPGEIVRVTIERRNP